LKKVQDTKADNSTISSFDYRNDNVGNRVGATLASGVRVTWVYDKSSQLTAERRSGVSGYANTFVYDAVGNRLVLNANGTPTTTVYDNANQIKYSTAAAGRTTYTFDANGNQQIVREPAGGRTTTTWNYENQPTLFRMPDGSRVTMTYNANKRRVDRE
jgi:YD repeat-containing protein